MKIVLLKINIKKLFGVITVTKYFTIKSITKKCVICNKKTILKNSKCSLHIDQEPVYCTAVIKSGPRKKSTL